MDTKCSKPLWYVIQLLWRTLKYLDDCCALMTDDIDENIDENFPLVIFKENTNLKGDVKIVPIKRKEEKGKKQKPVENKHPWDRLQ